jgi:Eco57I restriction-modification methylase
MTAAPALTTALQMQVSALVVDLRKRVDKDLELSNQWEQEHRRANEKERTAASWVEWREDRLDQAAVAWVLTSLFIRFCEDNALVKPVWITGPGKRRQEALDAQREFFQKHPEGTDREWLMEAIDYLGSLRATKALVDTHSALRWVSPSGDAATELLKFWRNRSDDGALIHDLHHEPLSTRFLGDLYQELSAHAKDKYALLQTPVFVEEFILDRTLEPALLERPLEGFRMIDPTCGSGHFLLGSLDRLMDRWHKHAPNMEIQAKVQSALDSIHGVDLNPFAVAIARFRLTVAALNACGLRSLEEAPAFKYHLAVGDSLIHGPDTGVLPGMEERGAYMPFHYATEDAHTLLEILEEARYDAVVGNPPYITVKDKALNKIYRSKFGKLCKGTYALSVPFMVQFFALAKHGEESGWVGMITSNSFMRREFGVPLVENFLPRVDLRAVIDSEGAWIPGHNTDGTPTVIVVGKSQVPVSPIVRAVLSKGSRETREHGNEGNGPYWAAIVAHWNEPGWDDDWITVTDLDRKALNTHPWSLAGGGAIELLQAMQNSRSTRLSAHVDEIGAGAVTREDSAYMLGAGAFSRNRIEDRYGMPLVDGDGTRDWMVTEQVTSLWPYNEVTLKPEASDATLRTLWPYKTNLSNRVAYGQTQLERGLEWFEYSMFFTKRFKLPLSIPFAEVATHNNFVLDRGGRIFKQTAPAIRLPINASEADHLKLLGVLNSSLICFWLKQQSQPKGGAADVTWLRTYQVSAATIQDIPLPNTFPVEKARILDSLAQELLRQEPSTICSLDMPDRAVLSVAQENYRNIQAQMVSLQEELDWEVYRLYGLVDEVLSYSELDLPGLALGERAFEISLARSGEQGSWFKAHGSTAITKLPESWPIAYRNLVQRRLELIAEHPFLRLLEKPEYKRRWAQESWRNRQEKALRKWLLDRLEDRRFWFDSTGSVVSKSIGQLGDEVTRDAEVVSVLALWEGRPDVPVAASLARLLEDEVVPFLSAYRYKDSGLRNRMAWEQTWDLQRRESCGETVGTIAVPPKYTSADFNKPSYWRARGKLDVPKERFILYPAAGREGDTTPLLGWAGWDHAQQALALAAIINDREQEGWDDERLVPLVAGLAELQPWVKQWHTEVIPEYGASYAEICREELDQRAAQVGKTVAGLAAWRPAAPARGRKKAAKG